MVTTESLDARLVRLIAAREPDARDVQVTDLKAMTGGNARRVWGFKAQWSSAGGTHSEQCVLLARAGQGQVEGDMATEYGVLAALRDAPVPVQVQVPRALWLDASGEILGTPGFVTALTPGRANAAELLKRDCPLTRDLVLQLVSLAARLHACDSAAIDRVFAGAGGQDTSQLLAQWQERFERNRLEPVPALASVFHWLARNLPASTRTTLVHGDLRIGNFLHVDGRITALLDWELAHRGDPLEDLAWLYRPLWSPQPFVSIEEAVAAYEAAAGVRVEPAHLAWWRIFCEARFAVISLTAARNFVEGRTDSLRLASRASTVRTSLELAFELIDQVEVAC